VYSGDGNAEVGYWQFPVVMEATAALIWGNRNWCYTGGVRLAYIAVYRLRNENYGI